MGSKIVEQLDERLECLGCGVRLLCRKIAEGGKNGAIQGTAVIEQNTNHLLDTFLVGEIEDRGSVRERRHLGLRTTVGRSRPDMGRMFRRVGEG